MAVRKVVSNEDFFKACVESSSIKELAEKSGLAESSCSARRVNMRKNGWVIPEFGRGVKAGTSRKDNKPTPEQLQLQATLLGKTVDEIQLESVKVVTTVAERSEKIKAGQTAAKE
jgi:hypothetical protein